MSLVLTTIAKAYNGRAIAGDPRAAIVLRVRSMGTRKDVCVSDCGRGTRDGPSPAPID